MTKRRQTELKYSYALGIEEARKDALNHFILEGLELNPKVVSVSVFEKWITITIEYNEF